MPGQPTTGFVCQPRPSSSLHEISAPHRSGSTDANQTRPVCGSRDIHGGTSRMWSGEPEASAAQCAPPSSDAATTAGPRSSSGAGYEFSTSGAYSTRPVPVTATIADSLVRAGTMPKQGTGAPGG